MGVRREPDHVDADLSQKMSAPGVATSASSRSAAQAAPAERSANDGEVGRSVRTNDHVAAGRAQRGTGSVPGRRHTATCSSPTAPALTRSRRILARARESAALAARARGWCATAPRFKQLR